MRGNGGRNTGVKRCIFDRFVPWAIFYRIVLKKASSDGDQVSAYAIPAMNWGVAIILMRFCENVMQ